MNSLNEEFETYQLFPFLLIKLLLELVGGMGLILSPKDAQAPSLAERAVRASCRDLIVKSRELIFLVRLAALFLVGFFMAAQFSYPHSDWAVG